MKGVGNKKDGGRKQKMNEAGIMYTHQEEKRGTMPGGPVAV